MEIKKIDITSTVLEKGIDAAIGFLGKLITPSVEEVGLLAKDQVSLWRFKTQVKILNKARLFCEKNNISPKAINLKILVPILEHSSLEEDELLQDKWAILISNLVDSEQNIENHVFPHILSQLSRNEFEAVDKMYLFKTAKDKGYTDELENLIITKKETIDSLRIEFRALQNKISDLIKNKFDTGEYYAANARKDEVEKIVKAYDSKESVLRYQIKQPASLPYDSGLKEFEISNLLRLGLLKITNEVSMESTNIRVPVSDDEDEGLHVNIDLDLEINSDEEIVLTELGELFLRACTEKSKLVK